MSRDPAFVGKVRDIVGLYLHPPEHAVVLSMDEKTSIQALELRRVHRVRGQVRSGVEAGEAVLDVPVALGDHLGGRWTLVTEGRRTGGRARPTAGSVEGNSPF